MFSNYARPPATESAALGVCRHCWEPPAKRVRKTQKAFVWIQDCWKSVCCFFLFLLLGCLAETLGLGPSAVVVFRSPDSEFLGGISVLAPKASALERFSLNRLVHETLT